MCMLKEIAQNSFPGYNACFIHARWEVTYICEDTGHSRISPATTDILTTRSIVVSQKCSWIRLFIWSHTHKKSLNMRDLAILVAKLWGYLDQSIGLETLHINCSVHPS